MAGKGYSSLIGRMVTCEWDDPSGFINEYLKDARLSKCTTWGILKEVREDCVVIQTSRYEECPKCETSEHGDYTVVALGCVTALRVYKGK
jgi:hypothetical protein